MKKISIVSEKNEENNAYEIRTIVIFDDNKAPEIINYEGVQNLMSVVEFAEKNGLDILGNDGIKPALENGLIEVISSANKKAMAELKAEIVREQLAHTQEEELTEEEQMENAINEELNELKEKNEEEPVEEKITSENTSFEEREVNSIPLPTEYRELAEYFRLEMIRANGQLPPQGLARIEELKSNEKVAGLEQARENVIAAEQSYDKFENKDSKEAQDALNDLREKMSAYQTLHEQYREELANVIKSLSKKEEEEKIEEPKKAVLKRNRLDLSVEDREYAEYLRLNILRSKKQLPPVGLARIEELKNLNEKVAGLEQARENVLAAMDRYNSIEDKTSPTAILAERDIKDRQREYDNLQARYRKEFAETIKNARTIEEEKIDEIEEQVNREDQTNVIPQDEQTEENTVEVEPQVEETQVEETQVEEAQVEEKPIENVTPVVEEPRTEEQVESETLDEQNNNVQETKEEPKVEPVIVPVEEKPIETTKSEPETTKVEENPKIKIVKDAEPKEAKGVNPVTDETTDVEYKDEDGKDHTIQVRKTSKLKEWLKRIGAFALGIVSGIGAFTGISALINKNKENKEEIIPPVVIETPEPEQENIINNTFVTPILLNYFNEYNVPTNTRIFLQQKEVMEFLSNYKNEAQLKEVISALAYGYEANVLTTKDGNFRLDEDGNNYLTSFTRDFLCSKAVVNGYSPREMLVLFGGQPVTYEQLMNGFKNYTYTVTTYGMNATEGLPFKYLTNNNEESTKVLNEIQNRLLEVNRNRKNNTLNSNITDDFIAYVFETYVLNDESLNLTHGAKTVGAALVSSFTAIQANLANGEPLYLHEDHGYAKAGINLKEVDGRFTFETSDKEEYEFTNLYDVMNHGYGDLDKTAARCLSEQSAILASLQTMQQLANSSEDVARLDLANALYQNGLKTHADRISAGSKSDALLDDILTINPMLQDEVEAYRSAIRNDSIAYVPFDKTVEGVDRLLGIQYRDKNNYADLINNRRNQVSLSNNFTVVNGITYTKVEKEKYTGGHSNGNSNSNSNDNSDRRIVSQTTVETHEKIDEDDLTAEEQEQAQQQIQQIEQQQEQQNQEQAQKIEEAKEDLREGVEEGLTQQQLEQVAAESGITLDPNYQQNMQEALEEQRKGEEERLRQEEEIRRQNEEAERAAREAAEREAQQQAEELRRQQKLINQSMMIDQEGEQENTQNPEEQQNPDQQNQDQQTQEDPTHQGPATGIDQTDEGRIDEEAGEEVYNPNTASIKDELNALKRAALALNVEADDLGIEQSGPKLG